MKYMFFDFETTGLNRERNKVIEIAAAIIDEEYKVIDTFSLFINPGIPIPKVIVQHTGITDQMVKHAVTEIMAFESFADFIKEHLPIKAFAGHNIAAFDIKWLEDRNERFKLGLDLSVDIIDTLSLARSIAKRGLMKGYSYVTASNRPSFKLENLMDYFQVGEQTHRAIDDVFKNIIVYKKLKELEQDTSLLGF